MTIITASIAIVIVVLTITLVLAAIGRVQTTQGSQRWLAIVLVLALIAIVALQTLDKGPESVPVSAEDPLQVFIASLPPQVRGKDADATRTRIKGLVEAGGAPAQPDCEALVGRNAEFARTLDQMRMDIRQAADIADTQQAKIEQLEAANRSLQEELGKSP
jgi:hypothetical protein